MKSLLQHGKRVLSLVLATGMALAAATYGAHAADSAPDKHFRLAVSSDPTTLDPHVQLSEETLAYSHWVFDPLIRYTKEMKMEPRLAESWEQLNPTTWRFKLRKGVKFHSGNSFGAKDVVFTLNRLKQSQEFKGLYEPFTGAKAVDELTVDIMTKEPYALVLNLMTYLFVLDSEFYTGKDASGQDKDFINKTGPSFANANASGTGPFQVVSHEQGLQLKLKAFPDYWAPHGNVASIDIKPIKQDATRVAALSSGDVDMIMPVPTQDYGRLEKDKDIQLVTMSSTRIILIQLNGKRRKELADPKVREAIIRATDNAGIAQKIMKGYTKPATQQTPEGMPGHAPDLTLRYDLEKAKALLKEAGYEKGLEFTMISPNNRYVNDEKIAEAFVGMMAKAGIKVSLKTMPRAQYWDDFDARVADIQLIGWHPDTEDAANYTEYLLMCPNTETGYGQYNSGEYCNPKIEELITAARTETDLDKRTAMLQEIERVAYNDSAFVPLHFEAHGWAGNQKLENFEAILNAMNFPYFGDLVMK